MNSAGQTGHQHVEEKKCMKIEPYLSPFTKLNSEMIKNFNIRSYTLNLIEESVGNRLRWTGIGRVSRQDTDNSGSKYN